MGDSDDDEDADGGGGGGSEDDSAALSRNRARSRNRALMKAMDDDRVPRVIVVNSADAREQVDEVVRALGIHVRAENLFSRCVKCCGTEWIPVSPERARSAGVSERTLSRVSEFWGCGKCGCVFWEGRQFQGAMEWMTERLCRLDCGRGTSEQPGPPAPRMG